MEESKSEKPDGTFGQFLGCVGLFVVAPAIIGGIIFLVMRATGGGTVLARVPMSPSPAQATFRLEKDTTVQAWANVDMRHHGLSSMSATEDLPHVVDYVIELRGEGRPPVAVRCNPFNTHIARTAGRYNSMGETAGRYYDGEIDGCALRLEAGAYTVQAHTEAVGSPDRRFKFAKNELVLRAP